MKNWICLLSAMVLGVWCLVQIAAPTSAADAPEQPDRELVFAPVKVDGPVHDPAKHTFWFGPFSECASVLDVDGDGKLDIAAGRNWYRNPTWTKHSNFRDGAETNGPETDNNSEFAMDVNRDGRTDIVSSGWMRMKGVYWYENPGKTGVKWKAHPIHLAPSIEGVIPADIMGKGEHDLLINHFGNFENGLTWAEYLGKEPWFKLHSLGPMGEGHGNGVGDINGDGRNDIVTGTGWWEAPPRPAEDRWIWHPDYRFGNASHPILVHDINADGLNDIIIGSPHGYGLVWLEQKMDGGKRSFVQHWIERDLGGFHNMEFGDLDGDGKPELITGKRLFPHHGVDPGERDPLFMFYYKIYPGRLQRHVLSFNHLQWLPNQENRNPPPNFAIGSGMKINIADIDGDGRNDIVCPGKSGLYIFYNKGYPPKTREPKLSSETSYPSWVEWSGPRPQRDREGFLSLFNGKDLDGWAPATNWTVENGLIFLKDRTDRQEHNDNYLWLPRTFGDFVLDLEFKAVQGTNSGIFVRTANIQDPVYTGIEIQVGRVAPGRPLGKGSVGGIYDLVAPTVNALKPDPEEWNRYTITCQGPRISVVLNGQLVSEADLSQWTEAGKNPDGTKNKFRVALKDYPLAGYIGLQDHGTPVWYRNIRIKTEGGR